MIQITQQPLSLNLVSDYRPFTIKSTSATTYADFKYKISVYDFESGLKITEEEEIPYPLSYNNTYSIDVSRVTKTKVNISPENWLITNVSNTDKSMIKLYAVGSSYYSGSTREYITGSTYYFLNSSYKERNSYFLSYQNYLCQSSASTGNFLTDLNERNVKLDDYGTLSCLRGQYGLYNSLYNSARIIYLYQGVYYYLDISTYSGSSSQMRFDIPAYPQNINSSSNILDSSGNMLRISAGTSYKIYATKYPQYLETNASSTIYTFNIDCKNEWYDYAQIMYHNKYGAFEYVSVKILNIKRNTKKETFYKNDITFKSSNNTFEILNYSRGTTIYDLEFQDGLTLLTDILSDEEAKEYFYLFNTKEVFILWNNKIHPCIIDMTEEELRQNKLGNILNEYTIDVKIAYIN